MIDPILLQRVARLADHLDATGGFGISNGREVVFASDLRTLLAEASQARANSPFTICSDYWPGITKLGEECSELAVVCAKMIECGGPDYWDQDLRVALTEEMGDVKATLSFVEKHNPELDLPSIKLRKQMKLYRYERWRKGEE